MPKMIEAHEHDPELWGDVLLALVVDSRPTNGSRFGQLLQKAMEHSGLGLEELASMDDHVLWAVLKDWFAYAEEQRKKA